MRRGQCIRERISPHRRVRLEDMAMSIRQAYLNALTHVRTHCAAERTQHDFFHHRGFPRARRREIDVLPGSAAQHRIRSFSPCVRVMVITLPRTLGGLPSENKVMYMYIVYVV